MLEKIAYKAQTTSLTSEVQRLKAANADVLMPSSYTSDTFLLLRTAKELDYNPKLIVAQNAGFTDPTFITTMGKDAEGAITRSPYNSDLEGRIPLLSKVNAIFKKLSNGRDLSGVLGQPLLHLGAVGSVGRVLMEDGHRLERLPGLGTELLQKVEHQLRKGLIRGRGAEAVLAGAGMLVHYGLIVRLLKAPMLAQVCGTFGLAIALRASAQFLWTPDFRTISNPWIAGRVQIGPIFTSASPSW